MAVLCVGGVSAPRPRQARLCAVARKKGCVRSRSPSDHLPRVYCVVLTTPKAGRAGSVIDYLLHAAQHASRVMLTSFGCARPLLMQPSASVCSLMPVAPRVQLSWHWYWFGGGTGPGARAGRTLNAVERGPAEDRSVVMLVPVPRWKRRPDAPQLAVRAPFVSMPWPWDVSVPGHQRAQVRSAIQQRCFRAVSYLAHYSQSRVRECGARATGRTCGMGSGGHGAAAGWVDTNGSRQGIKDVCARRNAYADAVVAPRVQLHGALPRLRAARERGGGGSGCGTLRVTPNTNTHTKPRSHGGNDERHVNGTRYHGCTPELCARIPTRWSVIPVT